MSSKGENSSCVCYDEHIIPNAIGGRLKSSKILCKKCGSNFGNNEDVAFVRLFNCFLYAIEDIMHFDRQHKSVTADAYNYSDESQKVVLINHEGAFPSNPYHITDDINRTKNTHKKNFVN